MEIFTVGYEGLDIDEFVDFLKKNKIRVLVDVRKNPVSRKRGFSKNKLAEQIAAVKTRYLHFPELGVPSAWRKQAKEEEITRAQMFRDYVKKILPKESAAIDKIIGLTQEKTALLCYERDAMDCHRLFVAQEMVRRGPKGSKITHLNVPIPEVRPLRPRKAATSSALGPSRSRSV